MNRSNASFRLYVAFGVVGIAGYFLLPVAAENIALIVSNLVALVAILYALRTRRLTPRPGWLLLAAFPAATAVGNTVYFVNDSLLHVEPFPSPGDAAFLSGYVFLAAGLLRIQQGRSAGRDATAALDAAIITVGFAAASWVIFMAPLLQDPASPLIERLTALGYPVGDVLVLAVAARFFLTARRRGPVFGWLAGTVIVMLVADTGFALLNLLNLYSTGHPVDVLILTYNLGWGAVALHRDAGDLTLPRQTPSTRPAWIRLLALTAASLVPACVLLVQVVSGHLENLPVIAGAGLLLFLLVMARMTALVHALEKVLAERSALEREVALSTSELNRIASIVTSSSDAIVGLSLDGLVTSWNPAAEKLYGRSSADALNQPQDIVAVEQVAAFRSSLDADTAEPEASSQEVSFTRTDGTTVPVAVTISPIRNGDTLTGISVIGSDVTERQRAEAALDSARAEALESSRLKSEFLATMSHEIRTPMNGVIGLTTLLLETSLDDVQRQYTQGVQTAGEALLTLINDILDLSKLEAGRVDLEFIDFDPRALVEEVGALLAREAHSKGLELLAHCEPDVPMILTGDAGRIRQVLLNLASNAVKFTSSGEVEIKLSMSRAHDGAVAAHFDVTDTGIGIPAESQPGVFNSFSQADASTTRRYGGTGLGLAICLRLVEAMNGQIGLASEVGSGSRFWFRLSLSSSPIPGDQQRPVAGLPSGLRVLVVDDNATNRQVLRSQLQSWEVETDVAADGQSALVELHLAASQGRPYDVAVLDLGMPHPNGLRVAQAISTDRDLDHTQSLVLTSLTQLDRSALAGAGVSHWLPKPVSSSAMYQQLRQLVVGGVRPDRPASTPPEQQRPANHARARVLVVEDNALNQLVTEAVLVLLGYQPEIVANGAEAVAALSSGSEYVAVLMDCHMPVMDGYEATRQIRSREGRGRRVPILAMTAGAMPKDRERALSAGMDDYITKPIVVEAVAELLARWTHPSPAVDASPAVPAPAEHIRTR